MLKRKNARMCVIVTKYGVTKYKFKLFVHQNFLIAYLWIPQRAISSVGLERCLDRAEVTGSNPV